MSGLGPEDRALFEEVRGADDPTEADRARNRRALIRRVGGGAVGTLSATGAKAALAKAGAVGLGAKAMMGVVVAVGVAAYAVHEPPAVRSPSTVAPLRPPKLPVSPPVTSPALASASAVATVVTSAPPAPPVTAAAAPARAIAVHAPAVSAPPPAPRAIEDDLDVETQLVASARAAMREGQPERALAYVDAHARRFPDGVLAEERSAERVFVLCAAGREEEAGRAASRFVRDFPRSRLAARVGRPCSELVMELGEKRH